MYGDIVATQFIEGKNNISTEEDDADGVHDHQ